MLVLKCDKCQCFMDIVKTMTVFQMCENKAHCQNAHESVCYDKKYKQSLLKLTKNKTDEELNKEYHIYWCKECGNSFDGITNTLKYFKLR